jgi:hypothetical protein
VRGIWDETGIAPKVRAKVQAIAESVSMRIMTPLDPANR